MRAVAEEHGPGPAEAADDPSDGPQVAAPRLGQGSVPKRAEAPEVVDGHDRPAPVTRLNHAVGIGQGRGQGLLAEDSPDTRLDRVHDDLGVAVVRSRYAQQIDLFAFQHHPVVGIGPGFRPDGAIVGPELLEQISLQVTDGDDLHVGRHGEGGGVRHGVSGMCG